MWVYFGLSENSWPFVEARDKLCGRTNWPSNFEATKKKLAVKKSYQTTETHELLEKSTLFAKPQQKYNSFSPIFKPLKVNDRARALDKGATYLLILASGTNLTKSRTLVDSKKKKNTALTHHGTWRTLINVQVCFADGYKRKEKRTFCFVELSKKVLSTILALNLKVPRVPPPPSASRKQSVFFQLSTVRGK